MIGDHAAEYQVLGAMLQSRNAIQQALGRLNADDFTVGIHRATWEAIVDLHSAGNPVDPLTVSDHLIERGHRADIDNGALLVDMSAAVPTTASVDYHARIVAKHSLRRRQADLGHELAERAADDTEDPQQTAAWALGQLEDTATPKRTVRLLVGDEIDSQPDPMWLVDGMLPEGLSVIYGRRSAAKSFLAMAWAFSIASGTSWHGRKVTSAPVVYVVAEGASGAKARRRAWMQANHVPKLDHVAWFPTAMDPADPTDASILCQNIERMAAGLVVLDTVARCMQGEENSTEDMKRFVAGCDRIRERTGASVLLVHHSDKQDSGLRGNSSLGDACDGIVHMAFNADGSRTVRFEKAKEAEPARPMDMELQPIHGSAVLMQTTTLRPSPIGSL